MKGHIDYSKEGNIYLRQSDRDTLQALEVKKSNKTITEEKKTEMTNLKAKRRRNKSIVEKLILKYFQLYNIIYKMSEGLKQSYFRKNLTGVYKL